MAEPLKFTRWITFKDDGKSRPVIPGPSKLRYALVFLLPLIYGLFIATWAGRLFPGGLSNVLLPGVDPLEPFANARRQILIMPLIGFCLLPFVLTKLEPYPRTAFLRVYLVYLLLLLGAFITWLYFIFPMLPRF